MLLKQSGEYTSPDLIYLKFERRAALKAVPVVEPGLRRIIHPIGLQPLYYVVMTRQQDDLSITTAPCLGESRRPDLCYLPVNNGRELIDNGARRTFTYQTRKSCTEPLPVAQYGEGAQPRRNIAQTHGRKRPSNHIEIPVWGNAVDDGFRRVPPSIKIVYRLVEYTAADTALTAAPHGNGIKMITRGKEVSPGRRE